MIISFTYPMLKKLSETVGFDVEVTSYKEETLYIYGTRYVEDNEFAQANIFIDFGARAVYVAIYAISGDYIDEEKKVRLDF